MQCATIAYIRLEQAVELRTGAALQQAQGAYRAFQAASWERAIVERVRPLYPDEMRFPALDSLLEHYGKLYQAYQRLVQAAKADTWQRAEAAAPLTRQHAWEMLALLQTAQNLGLELSDMIQSDEASRQRWQQMIDAALGALKEVDGVREEVDQMRAGLSRIDGVANDLAALKVQVQGRDSAGGLVQHIREIERKLQEWMDAPGDTRAKLTLDLGDLKQRFVSVEREVKEGWSSITRLTGEKVPRVERLLDDVRARFETVEGELRRRAAHEASLLQAYLDFVGKQADVADSGDALTRIDDLVYAMRHCPVDAYNASLHEAWHAAFKRLHGAYLDKSYEEARPNRLRGRRRAAYESARKATLDQLEVCEREALAKLEGHRTIKGNGRPAAGQG